MGASMSGSTSNRGTTNKSGSHRNRGWIPPSAANKIASESSTPKNWNAHRRIINKVLSGNEEFIRENKLTSEQVKEMASGLNPTIPENEHGVREGSRGKRVKLEWDHYKERQDGHDPYDLKNLRLVSPDGHIRKLGRKFFVASRG